MSSIAQEAGSGPAGENVCLPTVEASEIPNPPRMGARFRLRRPSRSTVALTATALIVACMFWLQGSPAPGPAAARPAPSNQWVDIVKPLPFYDLAGSEFGKDARLEARRHRTGGGRVDTLTFGSPADDQKPWMRLSMYRVGGEQPDALSFFVEMARRAAEAQIGIVRSAAPDSMPTRFGEFEASDMTLATRQGEKSCVGFRFGPERSDFRMSGIACGTAARPVDRAILYCTIDRLDLLSAGEDKAMRSFFAEAEAHRGKGCIQSRLMMAAARDNWLDAGGKQPPLRAGLQQQARKPRR